MSSMTQVAQPFDSFKYRISYPGNTHEVLLYRYEDLPELEQGKDSQGSCARFIRNGAMPDSDMFGIKASLLVGERYKGKWEAICAWDRQRIAADLGLAPPVGSLVQIVRGDIPSAWRTWAWGYQTKVAHVGDDRVNGRKVSDIVNQKQTKREFLYAFGPPDLRRALRRMSLRGTYINDLREETMEDTQLALIAGEGSSFVMGGDLHDGNCGIWRDRMVCIDFGYHSVLTSRYGVPTMAYEALRFGRRRDLIK